MRAPFSKGPLARRLRHRRRSAEVAGGRVDFVELDDMVDALCCWGASMPWAHELPGPAGSAAERRFAIDCPVLSCAASWFAVRVFGDDLEHGPEVLAVLPSRIAHRGVVLGWATSAVELAGDRAVAALALPTTCAELRTLQRLLAVAYSAAFRAAGDRT